MNKLGVARNTLLMAMLLSMSHQPAAADGDGCDNHTDSNCAVDGCRDGGCSRWCYECADGQKGCGSDGNCVD